MDKAAAVAQFFELTSTNDDAAALHFLEVLLSQLPVIIYVLID